MRLAGAGAEPVVTAASVTTRATSAVMSWRVRPRAGMVRVT
jgi:hypothetical protein